MFKSVNITKKTSLVQNLSIPILSLLNNLLGLLTIMILILAKNDIWYAVLIT